MEILIDDLGICDQCRFLGNHNDVERIYPACDITVLSSLYEGTPNVLLESMACGVPVVATNVSDNSHAVKDGKTGCLVELNDTEGMANRIKTLLADESLRKNMGENARVWAEKEFSLKQLAKKTETVYLDALRQKSDKLK